MNRVRDPRRRKTSSQHGLIAAYREGLGLAAVAVISDGAGIRMAAIVGGTDDPTSEPEGLTGRWWCRRADAEAVAAAATARMRRRGSRDGLASPSSQSNSAMVEADSAAIPRALASVLAAAKQLNVALKSDDEISAEAMEVVVRVDAAMQDLQRSGELKSINKAYRAYRLDATGRGERILRYDDWMRKYRENLIRQVALTLRCL